MAMERFLRGQFLHPHHPLLRLHKTTTFTCNACSATGTGTRYRCDNCDFDLHVFCAYCPRSLRSPLHLQHPLALMRKLCALCCTQIRAPVCYRCNSCGLDFHLRCLGIPSGDSPGACRQVVSSGLHPQHDLFRLYKSCDECRQICRGIFYRCNECDFDLHPICLSMTTMTTTPAIIDNVDTGSMYFFMHPEHELDRFRYDDRHAEGIRCRYWCEVCEDSIEGDYYGCVTCGFFVHKGCIAMRPAVRDAVHPVHVLHYQRLGGSPCVVCREKCVHWRYHCSACGVHVHLHCLRGPVNAPARSDHRGATATDLDFLV